MIGYKRGFRDGEKQGRLNAAAAIATAKPFMIDGYGKPVIDLEFALTLARGDA